MVSIYLNASVDKSLLTHCIKENLIHQKINHEEISILSDVLMLFVINQLAFFLLVFIRNTKKPRVTLKQTTISKAKFRPVQ